jgi:NADH dehydrogenase [ubiquinone] 1 alpha subcomplex assembly factor 6
MPKELRRPVFALRALNIETALIGDQVHSKEAALVQIRMQWWRDAVDALFRGRERGGALAPKHPVITALQVALETSPGIKKYHIKRILDAREADLLDPQPPIELSGLESYAESTATQLLLLQLGAAGLAHRDADHAVSHLGKAVGITTLLRGTAYHASRRRSYLPLDLCSQHGLSQEDLYSAGREGGKSSEGLRDVVLKVASVAKAHLDESRSLKPKLPPKLLSSGLMLPSLSCDAYLKALEAANFDPFDPQLLAMSERPPGLMHVLRMKWHLMSKSY